MIEQSAEEIVAHYRKELETVFGGRPWVVATDVLVASMRMAEEVLGLGASRVLAIGAERGTGDLPSIDLITQLDLKNRIDGSMMDGIHGQLALLANLPPEARRAVDEFDPEREARVVGTIFCGEHPVADRAIFGARPPTWQALEDKMIIDAFWDQAGVRRAPSVIVPTTTHEMTEAHDQMDRGMGAVWVGDNREGWHGGAQLLRWVRTSADAEEAMAFLGARCDQVRVMPFLDGIPCSIHGWNFPDTTIALRPCEMLVYRDAHAAILHYAGAATNWAPPAHVHRQMREAALRAGAHLNKTMGYRGSFTVDGVVTADGFLPTELNPRFGAAIGRMAKSIPELPLYMLHLASAEGIDLDYRPQELERLITSEAEENPVIRAMHYFVGLHNVEPAKETLALDDAGRLTLATPDDKPAGSIEVGSGAAGSLLFVNIEPGLVERHVAAAPMALEGLQLAARTWALPLPEMVPAPDYRDP